MFVAGASWEGVTNAVWSRLAVGPGETRSFPNVLADLFGLAKGSWGVVLVRGDSVPVAPVIVSRTYKAANGDVTGTFGLSVPALSVAAGVKPYSAAASNFLPDLRHDASFRTNLTVANLKDEWAEVEVVFRGAAGSVLGVPAKVTVEARGVKQLNSALSTAPAIGQAPIGGAGWTSPVFHFSAEMKLKRGTGVYPYATVIDQGTGDSIVVTPTVRPSATYRLPGIVRVKGKTGSYQVLAGPSGRRSRRLCLVLCRPRTGAGRPGPHGAARRRREDLHAVGQRLYRAPGGCLRPGGRHECPGVAPQARPLRPGGEHEVPL
jgi:hypothetical protein